LCFEAVPIDKVSSNLVLVAEMIAAAFEVAWVSEAAEMLLLLLWEVVWFALVVLNVAVAISCQHFFLLVCYVQKSVDSSLVPTANAVEPEYATRPNG